jgi:NADH-quinone oxidoreductase subunit H
MESPDLLDTLVIPLIKAVVVFAALILSVPFMVLFERKVIGRIQQRPGPNRVGVKQLINSLRGRENEKGKPAYGFWLGGELQTIVDGIKLLLKEDLMPVRADRAMFILAPIITLVPAFLTFMIVPFGPTIEIELAGKLRTISMSVTDLPVGILFYLAVSSIGIYGIVLAGWASNSKYALLGGLRSTAQLISYELTMALSLIGVLLIVGSFDLRTLIASQDAGVWSWHVFRQPIGFLFFLVAGFAETNRLPFDLPEGESELGAGFHTEYSSMKWAVFMMAEYINILTFAAIMTTLFLGGFHGPLAPPEGVELGPLAAALSGLFWFSIKVGAIFFFFVHVRGTLPRLRYDQLMSLGWKAMFPLALLNVVVTAGIIAMGFSVGVTGALLFAAGCVILFFADRFAVNAKRRAVGYAG